NLWITDFGLARLQNQTSLTVSGDLVGTLRYMSPEQALGHPTAVDHRHRGDGLPRRVPSRHLRINRVCRHPLFHNWPSCNDLHSVSPSVLGIGSFWRFLGDFDLTNRTGVFRQLRVQL